MTRFNNDMADFKPVFYLIRNKLKAYAAYRIACRQNAKLKPGASLEEREAARQTRWSEIRKQHPEGSQMKYDISSLLTAHRTMRGKAANHGIKAENAATLTAAIIEHMRQEIKTAAECKSTETAHS